MPVVMQDVIVSSDKTNGSDSSGTPIGSASVTLAGSTACFDGRLLTARDLTGEQVQRFGETTPGDAIIVESIDTPRDAMDRPSDEAADARSGGVGAAFGDGSVRFLGDDDG